MDISDHEFQAVGTERNMAGEPVDYIAENLPPFSIAYVQKVLSKVIDLQMEEATSLTKEQQIKLDIRLQLARNAIREIDIFMGSLK